MAKNWALEFGSESDRIEVTESVPKEVTESLTADDRKFLSAMLSVLEGEELDDEALQSQVFEQARKAGLKEKRAFVVMYRVLTSRKYGPRLGSFLNLLGYDWVAKRIRSVL
jgi:lysyl-tRNA synthetase class 1